MIRGRVYKRTNPYIYIYDSACLRFYARFACKQDRGPVLHPDPITKLCLGVPRKINHKLNRLTINSIGSKSHTKS
jgi:hypothetical protein